VGDYPDYISRTNPTFGKVTNKTPPTSSNNTDGPTFPNVARRVVTSTDKSDKKVGVDTESREVRQSNADTFLSNTDIGDAQEVTEDRIQAQRDAIDKGDEAAEEATKYRGFKKGGLLKRRTNKNK